MIRAIMNGCNGHMGKVITDICSKDDGIEIVAGVDINTDASAGYPVFAAIDECEIPADVIIDFSHISCIDALLKYSIEKQIPVVLCTTGLSDAQLRDVEEASTKVAVLKSANMSLGINLLMELLQKAAQILAPAGFDIEVFEKHHNLKLDAPSGTAIALAESINDAMDNAYEFTLDRSQTRKQREKNEIGIQAMRGGNIVGEHEVFFAGQDEVITFKHTAYSKAVFAKGAVEAAKYLAGKSAGYYTMKDVVL